MNVDFGLIAVFAIQLALVFLVYHAWNGVKREISVLEAYKGKYDSLVTVIEVLRGEIKAIDKRMDGVSDIPKASLSRIAELEAELVKLLKVIAKIEASVLSVGGRMSILQRWAKGVEKEPASQDEDFEGAQPIESPVSLPVEKVPGMPPGFGLVAKPRRASNG